jgi:hypothetical protein
LSTRSATLQNNVLASVPGTEEVTNGLKYLFDGALYTLVLIQNYGHFFPVNQGVHAKDKPTKIFPT